MKNSLRMTVAAAALTFGFYGPASANPAFLAATIAPQVIQFLPQILPIFGGIFGGGMQPGLPFGGQVRNNSFDNDEYVAPRHRTQRRHADYDNSNTGY